MVHSVPGLKPRSGWQQKHIRLRFECALFLFRPASFGHNACRRCIFSPSFAVFQGGGWGVVHSHLKHIQSEAECVTAVCRTFAL